MRFSSPYGAGQGFRCDICGNPGFDHWLYRCDPCQFDAHLHCAKTSNVSAGLAQGSSNQTPQDPSISMTTTRSVNFRSPPVVPSNNINTTNVPIAGAPPSGYPLPGEMNSQPANPTGQGQPAGLYVSTNPPTFVSPGPYPGTNIHPVTPVVSQPQVLIHPQHNIGVVPGTGPGGLLMAGVAAGAAQGFGQEIIQSTAHGLGLGNES